MTEEEIGIVAIEDKSKGDGKPMWRVKSSSGEWFNCWSYKVAEKLKENKDLICKLGITSNTGYKNRTIESFIAAVKPLKKEEPVNPAINDNDSNYSRSRSFQNEQYRLESMSFSYAKDINIEKMKILLSPNNSDAKNDEIMSKIKRDIEIDTVWIFKYIRTLHEFDEMDKQDKLEREMNKNGN